MASSPEIAQVLGDMFSVGRIEMAQASVDAACTEIPALAQLRGTPHTPPYHAEGPWVTDHIVRMFAAIDAIEHGVTFVHCGDLGTDVVFQFALADAERAIALSPNMFRAFALMHNIAKHDRLLLVADPGTPGEGEGFARSITRAVSYSTATEVRRFDTLRRAGLGGGIVATFDDADRAVVAPQYLRTHEAIVRHCGLAHAFVKFLTELCWSHQDVARLFVEPENDSAFAIFPARAGKAGLNTEKFLDALLAIALLDHDLGRIVVPETRHFAVSRAFARAEHAVVPARHAAREARHRHAQKLRVKAILEDAGIAPEILFAQCGVGHGPERGEVMQRVYAVIRGETDAASFGPHAAWVETRAHRAAALLAKEGLSV